MGFEKNHNFRPVSRFISEIIQDRANSLSRSTACHGRHCRLLGRLCHPNIERPFDFFATVYEKMKNRQPKIILTGHCFGVQSNTVKSTFNKVDLVEFNFVASVYWALVLQS